ncbi:hypothetical protein KRMM14A1259_47700 [Krasilnikovia sp. MM14-A1259]
MEDLTMPAEPTPAVTADDLLSAISDLCEVYAKAQTTRTLAHHAPNRAEYDNLTDRAQHWDLSFRTRFDALTDAIQAVAPRAAQVEQFRPVRVLSNGHVEIRARDQRNHPVIVALTGPEAVTVGVHLTAYAAIGLDRTGAKVDRVLPPMLTATPPATTVDTPATGRAPAPR